MRVPVSVASFSAALLLVIACGPAKGPDGKSVVVSSSAGGPTKEGVYKVGFSNGVVNRGEDGGIVLVGLNVLLTPPDGNGSNGLYIATRDPSVRTAQSLADFAANQVGFTGKPLEKQSPVWFANGGTLTVTAFTAESMSVSVIGATMKPAPILDGGAVGTFTVDADLSVPLLDL